jgi:hypothetical protein
MLKMEGDIDMDQSDKLTVKRMSPESGTAMAQTYQSLYVNCCELRAQIAAWVVRMC